VWVMDLASRTRRRLTAGVCQNDSPAWRADARSIVFASDCDRGMGLPGLFVLPLSQ
jgi:Tol biopolymer transport system component